MPSSSNPQRDKRFSLRDSTKIQRVCYAAAYAF